MTDSEELKHGAEQLRKLVRRNTIDDVLKIVDEAAEKKLPWQSWDTLNDRQGGWDEACKYIKTRITNEETRS